MKVIKQGLYIVPTPIGNLDDITIRALEILKNSDIILCEDTRRSLKLLNNFNIKKKLISYHKFNEKQKLSNIIEYLNEGKILSLISDAGTPTLSDPGYLLIQECIKQKIDVFPIPGASSITTAMSISGFDNKFIFYGFLPKTEKELEKELSKLKNLEYSLVFFITGIKINFYLKNFKHFFSDRNILLAREMTKIHETFYRSEVENMQLFKSPLKGEITVVISKKIHTNKPFDNIELKKQAKKYLNKYSLKDVVELISQKEKISKKKVYEICLKIKNND
jgi:16S rRNA (cytidine1402-2'-O)-methyltransferase|tara:strand:+ start:145 stop:978 length:834 start_codon:yes stop_codon:yes gene_type:complete